jgi:NAD(P)H-dependent flavin oxidoreductase YrpB (nitropropane dioxygenase family)
MFKSKYPIICAPMNGVSDLRLALACAEAGIVPSLLPYAYTDDEFKIVVKQVKEVSENIYAAYSFIDIVNSIDQILDMGITHIEILEFEFSEITEFNKDKINQLRKSGVKIILKILKPRIIPLFIDIIDAVLIKSSEAAGRSADDIDIFKVIPAIKKAYPTLNVIASGGVKNKLDIDNFLTAGACTVAIGTLFAMSLESSIPDHTKEKLLEKTQDDIARVEQGARQRAIIFNNDNGDDDFNNTAGLLKGLSTGTQGHVYMGNAIGTVTKIIPVQEIVNQLVS